MQTINFLCIGDIIGNPGRKILNENLRSLQKEHNIHFTIANVENSAGGFGVTAKIITELKGLSIQAFTSGNHIYDNKDILKDFNSLEALLRPLNFPPGNPGRGFQIFNMNSLKIAVVNLQGRVFIGNYDCPFQIIDKYLPQIKSQTNIILIDIHAEATSEKQALALYLDGKVSGVFGTHTHVMTADERILDNGTAYITDIGMVGSLDSVIGVEKDKIIKRFFDQMPSRFEPEKKGQKIFNGAIISVDVNSGKAVSIKRIQQTYAS
jgi:metallophosphoesterase (TIGR00282 family)